MPVQSHTKQAHRKSFIARGRQALAAWWGGQELLQSEASVAGGIGVPLGDGGHPALEPWALDDVVGDRRGRHFDSRESD